MAVDDAFSAGAALSPAGDARVPVRTLDGWAEEVGLTRLDVLKLDVEGAEPAVLRGARRTLARLCPALVVECNPPALLRNGGGGVRDLHAEIVRSAPHVVWLGRGGSRQRIRGAAPDAPAAAGRGRRGAGAGRRAAPRRAALRGGGRARRAPRGRPAGADGRRRRGDGGGGGPQHRPHALSGLWRAHPVRLASRWHRPDGRPLEEGSRAALPDPLSPGAAVRCSLGVVAPVRPGLYELVVSGVQEHYAWLDAHGPGAAARWPVEVA